VPLGHPPAELALIYKCGRWVVSLGISVSRSGAGVDLRVLTSATYRR
jgi:hypothetical protein